MLQLLIIGFIGLCLQGEVSEAGCSSNQMYRCMRRHMRRYHFTEIPDDLRDFDTIYCTKADSALSCLESIQCTSRDRSYVRWLKFAGEVDAAKFLCSHGDHQQTHSQLRTCLDAVDDHEASCDDVSMSIQPGSYETCRALNEYTNCLHEPFETRCNAEAAGLMRTFLQKQQGRYGCTFGEAVCSLDRIQYCLDETDFKQIPEGLTHFNTYCSKAESARRCFEENPCTSSSGLETYVKWINKGGLVDAANYMCSRGDRQHTISQYHTCMKAVIGHVPICKWDSSVQLQPGLDETCRELKRLINCMHEPFITHCDAQPAAFTLTYVQKQFGRYGCSFGGSGSSGLSQSMTSLMMMLSLSLLLMLLRR